VTINDARILSIELALCVVLLALGKRSDLQILPTNEATPTSTSMLEIVATDEHSILMWLVRRQVSDEPAVAEGCSVTIEHENAACMPRNGEQLASMAIIVDIAKERTTRDNRLTRARGAARWA
jgi:hypothetical protein